MTYATISAVFQVQVNRHMNATEWLINNTYRHFQNNHIRYAEAVQTGVEVAGILLQLGTEFTKDTFLLIRQAFFAIALFFVAAITLAAVTIRKLNQWVDAQVDQSIILPEVSLLDAVCTAIQQDFTAPILETWAIATAIQVSDWLF